MRLAFIVVVALRCGEYFGPNCHIYGIDIEVATRAYESERVSIFIGDQADPRFWSDFKARVGSVDVLIDDGGHTPHQQQVTLREMLSMVRPGGVYICEDIHGHRNPFINDAAGLVHELNRDSSVAHGETLSTPANSVQAAVYSICFYPFMMVIEKNLVRRDSLLSRRKGTQWQPFYSEYPVDSE